MEEKDEERVGARRSKKDGGTGSLLAEWYTDEGKRGCGARRVRIKGH